MTDPPLSPAVLVDDLRALAEYGGLDAATVDILGQAADLIEAQEVVRRDPTESPRAAFGRVSVPEFAVLAAIRYGLGRATSASDHACALVVEHAAMLRRRGWVASVLDDIERQAGLQDLVSPLLRWSPAERQRWERAAGVLRETARGSSPGLIAGPP